MYWLSELTPVSYLCYTQVAVAAGLAGHVSGKQVADSDRDPIKHVHLIFMNHLGKPLTVIVQVLTIITVTCFRNILVLTKH